MLQCSLKSGNLSVYSNFTSIMYFQVCGYVYYFQHLTPWHVFMHVWVCSCAHVCVCVCTCMCLHLLLWCVCAGLWATYRATRQDRARDWSMFCLDCLHSRHQPYSKVGPPVQQPVTSWFVAALASPICFPCCWKRYRESWTEAELAVHRWHRWCQQKALGDTDVIKRAGTL